MEAYKFETKILENGIIKVPQFEKYSNREVELFIVLKPQKTEKDKKLSIDEFLEEWTGFAKGAEKPDDAKYKYLTEKYA